MNDNATYKQNMKMGDDIYILDVYKIFIFPTLLDGGEAFFKKIQIVIEIQGAENKFLRYVKGLSD
jgi:hypothetical protein